MRYSYIQDAQTAIQALDGTTVLGHKLQVKFADADAGPPAAASPSGLTPSDSCYAKHLPASWGVSVLRLGRECSAAGAGRGCFEGFSGH